MTWREWEKTGREKEGGGQEREIFLLLVSLFSGGVQLVVVSLFVASEHDIFSEAVRQEGLDLTQSLGEASQNLLSHQGGHSQTQDRAIKRYGGEHEGRDKVSTLPHLNGDSSGSIQVRVGNKDVVTTVNDVGAPVLLQLRHVEASHGVNISSELAVVTLNDLQTLGNSSGRERVRSSGKSDTGRDGKGLNIVVVGHDVSAIGRKGLGEHTTDVVTGTDHVKMLFNTVTSFTQRTERVSFIHNNESIKFITKLPGLGQVGNGSIGRVDSVNNKERATRVLVTVLCHQITESIIVLVREFDNFGTSQLGSVPQADVALLVHKDDTTLRAQVGNQVHASKET